MSTLWILVIFWWPGSHDGGITSLQVPGFEAKQDCVSAGKSIKEQLDSWVASPPTIVCIPQPFRDGGK